MLVSQTLFRKETSYDVEKCRLFFQANKTLNVLRILTELSKSSALVLMTVCSVLENHLCWREYPLGLQ